MVGHFEFQFGQLNFWNLYDSKYICANFHAFVTKGSILVIFGSYPNRHENSRFWYFVFIDILWKTRYCKVMLPLPDGPPMQTWCPRVHWDIIIPETKYSRWCIRDEKFDLLGPGLVRIDSSVVYIYIYIC